MNNFLPEGYKIPESTSNYMKFADGLNRVRVLSSAIVGYEYFTTENKPIHSKEMFKTVPSNIKKDGKVKPFWAFCVWNYQVNKVQVLEITQKTIMNSIHALVSNEKWGDPKMYDIAITKTGEGMETEYNVQGEPLIAAAEKSILDEYNKLQVNLDALFTNDNPFDSNTNDVNDIPFFDDGHLPTQQ